MSDTKKVATTPTATNNPEHATSTRGSGPPSNAISVFAARGMFMSCQQHPCRMHPERAAAYIIFTAKLSCRNAYDLTSHGNVDEIRIVTASIDVQNPYVHDGVALR